MASRADWTPLADRILKKVGIRRVSFTEPSVVFIAYDDMVAHAAFLLDDIAAQVLPSIDENAMVDRRFVKRSIRDALQTGKLRDRAVVLLARHVLMQAGHPCTSSSQGGCQSNNFLLKISASPYLTAMMFPRRQVAAAAPAARPVARVAGVAGAVSTHHTSVAPVAPALPEASAAQASAASASSSSLASQAVSLVSQCSPASASVNPFAGFSFPSNLPFQLHFHNAVVHFNVPAPASAPASSAPRALASQ